MKDRLKEQIKDKRIKLEEIKKKVIKGEATEREVEEAFREQGKLSKLERELEILHGEMLFEEIEYKK